MANKVNENVLKSPKTIILAKIRLEHNFNTKIFFLINGIFDPAAYFPSNLANIN